MKKRVITLILAVLFLLSNFEIITASNVSQDVINYVSEESEILEIKFNENINTKSLDTAKEITINTVDNENTGEEPTAPEEQLKDGFVKEGDGNTYYYIDGAMYIPTNAGVEKVENKYYYFYLDGHIHTPAKAGVAKAGGKYYYFYLDGHIYSTTGKHKIGTSSYYFNEKREVYVPTSAKVTKKGGKYYYFNTNGVIYTPSKSKVVKKKGKYYYFYKDGHIYTKAGKHKLGGKYYYINSSKKTVFIGWKTIKKKKHYFTTKGAKTGWAKIGKYYYNFSKYGKLYTNTIRGKYYVNKKGRRVTDKATMYAVKLVKKVSKKKKNNTKSKKLRACYDYIWKNTKYKRIYEDPLSFGDKWYSTYAKRVLIDWRGNCFAYAAAFGYCARVLGYDAKVVVGNTGAIGGGWTPHGWAEVKIKGEYYLYDPDMQMNYPNRNAYKRTYKNPPYKYQIKKKCFISI